MKKWGNPIGHIIWGISACGYEIKSLIGFRPHWTQSELIKHMSSLLRYGTCKKLWYVVDTFIIQIVSFWFNGLQVWPEFSLNDIMWLLSKPFSASIYVGSFWESQDVLHLWSFSVLRHDSCTIFKKNCLALLHAVPHSMEIFCIEFFEVFLLSHQEWSDSWGQVILCQA